MPSVRQAANSTGPAHILACLCNEQSQQPGHTSKHMGRGKEPCHRLCLPASVHVRPQSSELRLTLRMARGKPELPTGNALCLMQFNHDLGK